MDPEELEKFRELNDYYRNLNRKNSGGGSRNEEQEMESEMNNRSTGATTRSRVNNPFLPECDIEDTYSDDNDGSDSSGPLVLKGPNGPVYSGPKAVIHDFAKEHNNNLKDFRHVTQEILDVIHKSPTERDAEVNKILERRKKELKEIKSQPHSKPYIKPKFGKSFYITYHDYNKEVYFGYTSCPVTVIVLIYNKALSTYAPMTKAMDQLAKNYSRVKFVCLEANSDFVTDNFVIRSHTVMHTVLRADDEIGVTYEELLKYFFERGYLFEIDVTESCVYGSSKYYALCGIGGILSCGITHTAVVPLDLVKCRIQTDPQKYKSMVGGMRATVADGGLRSLAKGWAPTFIGYSLQGLGKFGFYEVFKNLYSSSLSEENAYLYRTTVYLAASASAEFFADILLAPMEAVKVRIQTQPGWANSLREGAPKLIAEEGLNGFYKGIVPLWCRQIPYTMMKFACFERTVESIYKNLVPKPRSECTKKEQLLVTFAAGYIAGVFCAVVSHPADTIVSVLNKDKGSNALQVLRSMGMKTMWRGLTTRIIMIGTLTALQWFIYDYVKVTLGIPRPPPPTMPESLLKKQQ